ncbi:MAG TPA: saccharopine dehydrogenase NADP-binding domain-containing protein [Thermoanaerobaculia bacterium]|nr:saccharopine dehydrogenase NADP-binding domain-containing protein [Thermoanaerobaculia bacterium]
MIAVFGGYGTFGAHASRALAAAGFPLRIAGRDGEQARTFAAGLGDRHEGIAADASDPASCARALAGAHVVVSCAGPFSALGTALPESCLAAGVHYVDIADDRAWHSGLRSWDDRFRERGLTAAVGCSSLPGISGALAVLAAKRLAPVDTPVEKVRVTLFIGNRNPKGEAAVRSAAAQLGRIFPAPQGLLRGLAGREIVNLPPPFGARAVHDWESPELDLFPVLLGAKEVRVKVGFESGLANTSAAALARLGPGLGGALLGAFTPVARALSRFGHSGGFVKVELWTDDGATASAALGGARDGQRMAALPAAFVARSLYEGSVESRGVVTAWETLGAEPLIDRLIEAGYELAGSG